MCMDRSGVSADVNYQNYYLYNWQCAPIDGGTRGAVGKQSAGIGVVML